MPFDLNEGSLALLMQIPLAGVVVLVVLIFLWFLRDWAKSEREARAADHAEDRKSRATEQTAMRDYIAVQNELFLQSVKDIREQNNLSLSKLAEEIKLMSQQISVMNNILTAHDAATKARSERSRA